MNKKGQGFAKRVTLDNIDEYKSLLSNAKERKDNFAAGKSKAKSKDKKVDSLFDGEPIKVDLPFKTISKKKATSKKKEKITTLKSKSKKQTHGELVWEKKLPTTDAQNQAGKVTGCVKLTQAEFKVGNEVINHRTYFREKVFASLDWETIKQEPFTEKADVAVDIVIDGKSYGSHSLIVRHKPRGESKQGNAPTQLHWGDMKGTIRKINPTGKTLKLFSVKKKPKNFIIEIS